MTSIRGSSAARASRLVLEELETRQLLAVFQVSGQEQLLLERLNDARANPAAYGAAIGVDLSNVAASQPLALNPQLVTAARGHAQDMNDQAYFDDIAPGAVDPGKRLTDAGFTWNTWGESSLGGPNYNTAPEALQALITDKGFDDFNHRVHLLNADPFYGKENQVGIGIVQNGAGPLTNYYTIDTAVSDNPSPFITGVVFNDANANGKYDVGEGISGATITVVRPGATSTQPIQFVAQTQAYSSGGYSVQVAPGSKYLVTVSGGGLAKPIQQTVTVGTANARVNFSPDNPNQSKLGDLNAFVGSLYQDLLGRPGSPDEISLYTNAMLKGTGRDVVTVRFLTSDEYSQRLLGDWFQTYLNRNVDDVAQAAFVPLLRSQNQKLALAQILASTEYFVNHEGTNEGFVAGLYHDLLGRDASDDEVKGWVDQLATRDRASVALKFMLTSEAATREVTALYPQFLRRNADSSSDVFVKALQQGVDSRSVLANIIISDEYFATARQALWLEHIYQDVLGRQAGPDDLTIWLANLRSGMRADMVAAAIADSDEAHQPIVRGVYQSLLGRDADSTGLAAFSKVLLAGGSVANVIAGVAGSPEYFANHGSNNEDFVRGLYNDLLHRSASDDEVSGWLQRLTHGTARAQVATAFATSAEYQQPLVQNLYLKYLHRSPTDQELQQSLDVLHQGISEPRLAGGLIDMKDYVVMASM